MSRRLHPCTRRAFLGRTAAVVAATGTAAVVARLAGDSAGPAARLRPTPAPGLRPAGIAENSLPGDRDWWIRDQGAPDEIAGYAGQASVLPGQPVDLYVSTTAREFTVRAFRMGWYNGDLARQVWASARSAATASAPPPSCPQRPPARPQPARPPPPRFPPTPCAPTGASP